MPDEAKALQKVLSENFVPFSFTASGLNTWRYLGGPREFAKAFDFPADH